MTRALTIAALALAGLLALAAAAAAATPQTSLADVEDEVMCPICGTLLELSEAPQAERQRAFVSKLVAEGRGKAEIKDALVAEYGKQVLALPEGSGFQLSAYLVPAIAFVGAALALAFGVRRWRRDVDSGEASSDAPASRPRGEEAEELGADLARYDL